jgi:hypothetical protein
MKVLVTGSAGTVGRPLCEAEQRWPEGLPFPLPDG